jgi:hypothetical protein
MPRIKFVVAIVIALGLLVASKTFAGTSNENVFLGTTTDAALNVFGDEEAYHVPQYMVGFPTAATIWPRVVQVDCVEIDASNIKCEGYNWSPKMGRGEYLYFQPVMHKAPKPVYIEVQKKPIGE